jgi:glutamyl-tRNA reductase
VEVRDQVAVKDDELRHFLHELLAHFELDGVFVLSTCNRTEIVLSGPATLSSLGDIAVWLDHRKQVSHFSNPDLAFHLTGEAAVAHLFRVISSMDSLILGEPQITNQVKTAFQMAFQLGTTDTVLNKLFSFAIQAQKRVRTETYLSDGAISVSFAGVELARKIFAHFEQKTVLLVGAGETAELAARHFLEKGIGHFHIANRTPERAQKLAELLEGEVFGLEDLASALDHVDIVITATGSPGFVLTPELLKPVCRARRYQPLLIIDLAIPRDVDPAVERLEGVFLYNLDHLGEMVALNLEKRQGELPKAEAIVRETVEAFEKWMDTHSMSGTIAQLTRHFEQIRVSELSRLKNRLPQEGLAEVEYLTKSMLNKILHDHIRLLKQSEKDNRTRREHLRFFQQLYHLEED